MAQAVEAQRAIERAGAEEEREQARLEEPEPAQAEIAGGGRVKHVRLGGEGVVQEVRGAEATVQMGPLRSKVALADLVAVKRPVAQASFRSSRAERLQRAEAARAAAVEVRVPLVDLRGMRVDEALRELELSLDRHLRPGEETVHVLHRPRSGAPHAAGRAPLPHTPHF